MLMLFYLDGKISKKERTKLDYIKIFLSTGIVSGGLQFLIIKKNILQNGGSSNIEPQQLELSEENISSMVSKTAKPKKMHTDLPMW